MAIGIETDRLSRRDNSRLSGSVGHKSHVFISSINCVLERKINLRAIVGHRLVVVCFCIRRGTGWEQITNAYHRDFGSRIVLHIIAAQFKGVGIFVDSPDTDGAERVVGIFRCIELIVRNGEPGDRSSDRTYRIFNMHIAQLSAGCICMLEHVIGYDDLGCLSGRDLDGVPVDVVKGASFDDGLAGQPAGVDGALVAGLALPAVFLAVCFADLSIVVDIHELDVLHSCAAGRDVHSDVAAYSVAFAIERGVGLEAVIYAC